MAVTTTNNKPLNPRGNDQSPKGYNRAELYSGKALDFDGVNDYVNLDGFTMSGNTGTFCFYADIDNDAYIFDMNPNRFIIVHNQTSGQGIRVFNNNAWTNYGNIDRVGVLFYTIVCDGTSQSVFVNGQQHGSTQTVTALDLSSATGVKLMSNYNGNGTFANGAMSGFRIFNTALTAAQVADLYNNPEKIVPTGVADSALKLWLPMQEGAGTTAYDGSGNGNHGTISGATWTHGVGAPVAQTAVIDWNKGQNIFTYSEDFTQWGNARTTDTANATTAPDGSDNAIKLEQQSGQTNAGSIYLSVTLSGGNDYQISVFAKAAEKDFVVLYDSNANRTFFNVSTGVVGTNNSGGTATIEALANDWYKCTITYTEPSTGNANVGYYLADTDNSTTVTDSGGLYLWGPSIALEGKNNAYLPTYGTIQNSDVLLPQGLTTGRDITGVNLFENVRKQGALNLDGNSWAEVHDNASLDITDAITLEAWVYWDGTANNDGVLGRWFSGATSYMLYAHSGQMLFYTNTSSSAASITGTGWKHVIGTYDLVTRRMYIDGQEIGSGTAYNSPLATSDKPIEIGKYGGSGAAASYQNQIAQPRIYNRALTAEEVERNYNAGKNIYK